MVCFEVEITLALSQRVNQGALERRVEHVVRHCNADLRKVSQTDFAIDYTIRLCDEETKTLLRDLPTPFNVKRVTILRTKSPLYTYRNHHVPPQIPLLQDIYWLAKSTERWKILESQVDS